MANTTLDLPCYINDIVYVLYENLPMPAKRRVTEIHINQSLGVRFDVRNDRTGDVDRYFEWEFGRRVFTDFNAAQDAQKKKRGASA